MKHSIIFTIGITLLISLSACKQNNPENNYSMATNATFSDNRMINMEFTLCFENTRGVKKMEKKHRQFKYALSMVIREHTADEFSKPKMSGILKSLAAQVLHENVADVKISTYSESG